VSQYIQATITIMSLISPVICAAIFLELDGAQPPRSGLKDASKATLAIFIVLAVAALIGVRVLGMFGISLSAFEVASGIVLIWMGFSTLRGSVQHASAQRPAGEGASRLTPLILFGASPGTITGVITIAANHSGTRLPVTALAGVTVAARSRAKRGSGGLVHDITARFMGLIVLAMGVQFALTGYRAVMKSA
jgi:multiple antibiotic resistance protein